MDITYLNEKTGLGKKNTYWMDTPEKSGTLTWLVCVLVLLVAAVTAVAIALVIVINRKDDVPTHVHPTVAPVVTTTSTGILKIERLNSLLKYKRKITNCVKLRNVAEQGYT